MPEGKVDEINHELAKMKTADDVSLRERTGARFRDVFFFVFPGVCVDRS